MLMIMSISIFSDLASCQVQDAAILEKLLEDYLDLATQASQ